MSLTESEIKYKTTADFELGFANHKRETTYSMVEPAKKSVGLVVYIPGFGKDLSGNYAEVFCQKIAEKYSLTAISVDYHCKFSRNTDESSIHYEAEDIAQIEKLFLAHKQPFQGSTVAEGVQILNKYLADTNQQAKISATLLPGKNEYQNAGVLQALDIINAVEHVLLNNPNIPAENVILIGSSYGGYIANMATKIAPNTFRAVFDNSSWASPHLTYIVGREVGACELSLKLHSNITTGFYVRSAWVFQKGLTNSFDANRYEIRNFSSGQLEEMFSKGLKTYYYFVHAESDNIASTEQKVNMAKKMTSLGLNVHMEVLGKEDVDGVYVKNINHGMNLSMLTLFDKAYSKLKMIENDKKDTKNDFSLKSKHIYKMDDYQYVFDYKSFPVKAYTEEI